MQLEALHITDRNFPEPIRQHDVSAYADLQPGNLSVVFYADGAVGFTDGQISLAQQQPATEENKRILAGLLFGWFGKCGG